jgi:hypothetical protein
MTRIAESLTGGAALVFAVLAVSAQGTEPASEMITPDAGVKAPQETEPRDPLAETAIWLSERSDPRQHAAGLLYRFSMIGRVQAARSGDDAIDAASTLDELERAIERTTDGAALAWLALACSGAGIAEFCIERGLDEAIVSHDGGNFFSRATLRPRAGVDETHRLLLEATVRRTYEPERVALWHEALQRYDWQAALEPRGVTLADAPFSELSFALLAGFSSFSVPASLVEACESAPSGSAAIDRACREIASEMAKRGRTASHRLMGLRLLSKRARSSGDAELAVCLDADLDELRNRFYCQSRALSAIVGHADAELQRDYVRWLHAGGEIGALERLAELADLDCSSPPDARAEALKQAGVDPAADT